MVQKSGVHQLRLVVEILQVLYIQTVVGNGISEPSTASIDFWVSFFGGSYKIIFRGELLNFGDVPLLGHRF